MAKKHTSIFICWTAYHTRSVALADHLSASCRFIWFKKPITVPLRYFFQPIYYLFASASTLYILFKQKPNFIFVQNPPFLAALIVWLYCLFNNAHYILDTHSGAFTVKRWSRPTKSWNGMTVSSRMRSGDWRGMRVGGNGTSSSSTWIEWLIRRHAAFKLRLKMLMYPFAHSAF